MKTINSNSILDVCLTLFSIPFFCFVLGSLGLFVGIPVSGTYACIAFILAILWFILRNCQRKEERTKAGILFLLFLILQTFFMVYGSLHIDNAIDSQIYHKPAAILLAEGWNPVYEADVYSFYERKGIDSHTMIVSHLQYFPKGQWIVNAIFYRLTGNIDFGDYVNYILMASVFIVSYSVFREWLKISRAFAFLSAMVIALNPIAICNLENGYIDGNLGNSFLIFLLSSVCFIKNGNRRWIPWIFMSAVYGCSLKHTAVPYFGTSAVVLTLPLVWNSVRRRFCSKQNDISGDGYCLKKWLMLMFSIPVAVLILCANPYITNTINHTSPFYPLHSFDEENHPVKDVLKDWYSIESFEKAGPIQRFVASYFLMYPRNIHGLEPVDYDFSKIGMIEFHNVYCDLNALGWIFAIALILSIFMFFFLPHKEDCWILLALLATILIQPHSWWARYVPQIWAFPVLSFCIVFARFQSISWVKKRLTLLCGGILAMLFAQGILCLAHHEARMLRFLQLEQKFYELAEVTPDPCVLIGDYFKEEPGIYYPVPIFYFYHQKMFQNLGFAVSQIEPKFARQPIEGEPVAHFGRILLISSSRPMTASSVVYDEVELDEEDVEIGKILPGILWKLNLRWKQLTD